MNNNCRILINVKQTEKKQKFQIYSEFAQHPQRNCTVYPRTKTPGRFGAKTARVLY